MHARPFSQVHSMRGSIIANNKEIEAVNPFIHEGGSCIADVLSVS